MANFCIRLRTFLRTMLEAPVPHNSLEVHRTLLTIYRINLISLFLSLPTLLLHTTILIFALVKEERCDKPLITWLLVVASLTAARIVPQCIIMSRTNILLMDWVMRPVAYETSLLVKSFVAQIDRVLWIASFVWFFIGFEWAYRSLTCNTLSPVLYQYTTVLILFFLAMIGMNCVLCMGSSTMLILACLVPSERFVQLFEENRRGSYALPIEIVKRMKSVEWRGENAQDESFPKMCTICLGEYEEGQLIRQLPCYHWFHQGCIDKWFKNNSTCPFRCHVNMLTGKRLDSSSSCEQLNQSHSSEPRTVDSMLSPTYNLPVFSEIEHHQSSSFELHETLVNPIELTNFEDRVISSVSLAERSLEEFVRDPQRSDASHQGCDVNENALNDACSPELVIIPGESSFHFANVPSMLYTDTVKYCLDSDSVSYTDSSISARYANNEMT